MTSRILPFLFFFTVAPAAHAERFVLPEGGRESVIGEIQYVEAEASDTLVDIARRYDLGYDAIVEANRSVDRWVPGEGTRVILPRRFVLPSAPREGIVINISELRLYYFPRNEKSRIVLTYPISVGRMDWKTPLGRTTIVRKDERPEWRPPASIRAEHAADGESLKPVYRAGDPENPLGLFALRLGIPGYLIHGVDARKEAGIGMRVTHGCIRMYPEDIEELFRLVPRGTPVTLVDQPVKAGWQGSYLLLEVHSRLDEDEWRPVAVDNAMSAIQKAGGEEFAEVDYEAIARAVEVRNGVSALVGRTTNLLPPPAPTPPKRPRIPAGKPRKK